MNNSPNYKEEIQKTGFILEYKISRLLRDNKWNIISNKYYEDDLLDSIREIDVLAYKVAIVEEVYYYTVLLVSCKKSEENVWALVSREINLKEPNSNWLPLHFWSNDTALKDVTEVKGFGDEYNSFLKAQSVSIIDRPEVDVFAFQEMNKKNGKPQNDKNIFNSIITLVKAQAYEIGSLNSRKKETCIYQFNLVSVIDSELFRLMVTNEEISQLKIDTDQIVTRYIVNRKEQFFKLRFVTADYFHNLIPSYDNLHSANCDYLISKRSKWFEDILLDYRKTSLLEKEFFIRLQKKLKYRLHLSTFYEEIHPYLSYNRIKSILEIYVTKEQETSDWMNGSPNIMKDVKSLLNDVFHYTGNFKFGSDILPF